MCSDCDGKGTIVLEPCTQCKGNKWVEERKVMEIEIVAGTEDGEEIVLQSEGGDFHKESLTFRIKQKEHAVFKRRGVHLETQKTISLAEALTGFVIYVESIDSKYKFYKIKNEDVVQPHTVKIIPNAGMPFKLDRKRRGDLQIYFTIVFPMYVNPMSKYYLKHILLAQTQEKESNPLPPPPSLPVPSTIEEPAPPPQAKVIEEVSFSSQLIHQPSTTSSTVTSSSTPNKKRGWCMTQ